MVLMDALTLGWNSNGAVLAVGYGHQNHVNWCTHSGCVSTWSVDRQSFNRNKPDVSLDIPACVTALQWHPDLPSMIAVGAYNGIVYVIDFSQSRGKEVLAQCLFDESSHTEPVTQVRPIVRAFGFLLSLCFYVLIDFSSSLILFSNSLVYF